MRWYGISGFFSGLWRSRGRGARLTLLLCLGVFIAQQVVGRLPGAMVYLMSDGSLASMGAPDPLTFILAIHGRGLAHGFFWTPVTYMFLHGSAVHLLLNCVGLWVMGGAVEALIGTRRFWRVFLFSGVSGGIGWALAQGLASGVPCVGASGGVLGLIGAYAVLRPRDTFMLVFPIPVVISARTLALILAATNAIDLAFGHGNVAYLAHLVGLVAGALYAYKLRGGGIYKLRASRLAGFGEKRRPRGGAETLDEVLDKIQRRGMGSLDDNDRRILAAAAKRGLEGAPGRR